MNERSLKSQEKSIFHEGDDWLPVKHAKGNFYDDEKEKEFRRSNYLRLVTQARNDI